MYQFRRLVIYFPVLVSFVMAGLCGCNSNGMDTRKKMPQDLIYFDYQVGGDEDGILVRLQFRHGYDEGNTMLLPPGATVSFDDQVLRPDSSRMNGPYYEISGPLRAFAGRHRVKVTNLFGVDYLQEFSSPEFGFRSILPDSLARRDLAIELNGLDSVDYLHLLLTDTSYRGQGIDRVDTVRNGRLELRTSDLEAVHSGPIHLELYREQERRLRQPGPAGGRLYLYFRVGREWLLQDIPNP